MEESTVSGTLRSSGPIVRAAEECRCNHQKTGSGGCLVLEGGGGGGLECRVPAAGGAGPSDRSRWSAWLVITWEPGKQH